MTAPRRSTARFGGRTFLAGSALALGSVALTHATARRAWGQGAPAATTADRMRPGVPCGVQSGDVSVDRTVVWSRTDRPARLIVEYATTDSFANPRRVTGPAALPGSDFTARVDLSGLPAGQEIFYRVIFQD